MMAFCVYFRFTMRFAECHWLGTRTTGAAGPIAGPVLGATLAEKYNLQTPFWFCSFTCGITTLLMAFCLKETLPEAQRKEFQCVSIPNLTTFLPNLTTFVQQMTTFY